MRINEEYLQQAYALFGRKAKREIRESLLRIIESLASMEPRYQEAVIAILHEEVKKAIIFD